MGMLVFLITVIIASALLHAATFQRLQATQRREVRLEAKVVEQASDLATCRGHIGALTTSIERLSAGDELVRATSAGIADAITRVLNPLGATSDTPDLDASRSRVTYDTYLPWGADEPVELDDDGIIIMQGSPPGTPDDWDEVDDERFISGPFSAPEEIEP